MRREVKTYVARMQDELRGKVESIVASKIADLREEFEARLMEIAETNAENKEAEERDSKIIVSRSCEWC